MSNWLARRRHSNNEKKDDDKLSYLQIVTSLWENHTLYDLALNGPISLQVHFPLAGLSLTKTFDLKQTTSEICAAVVKEFGKKLPDTDPSVYGLVRHYSPLNCSYSIQGEDWLLDSAPLWLCDLRQQELIELRRKPKTQPDNSDYISLKIMLPEAKRTWIMRFPLTIAIGDTLKAINSCTSSIGIKGREPLDQSSLKYYGLHQLTRRGWLYLESDQHLTDYELPEMCIVSMHQRLVIELEFMSARGVISQSFAVNDPEKKREQQSEEDSLSGSSGVSGSPADGGSSKHCSRKHRRHRKRETTKVFVDSEKTVGETISTLLRWTDKTFGNVPWTSPQPEIPEQESSRKIKNVHDCKHKCRGSTSRRGVNRTARVFSVPPGKLGFSNGIEDGKKDPKKTDVSEKDLQQVEKANDQQEELDNKNTIEQSVGGETDEECDESQCSECDGESESNSPDVTKSCLNNLTGHIKDEFILFCQGSPLSIDEVLSSIPTITSGSLVELSYACNVVQFSVRYTPSMASSPVLSTEHQGEVLVLDTIRDVRHMYTTTAGVFMTIPGYLSITNYQIFFQSYQRLDREELRIPLGTISEVKKVGGKKNTLDKYYLEITCKDFRTVKLGFSQDSDGRRKVFSRLNAICFVKPAYDRLFAFSFKPDFPQDGWNVYDVISEFTRQGAVGNNSKWRLTYCNKKYALCDTYPTLLVVPETASDDLLKRVSSFRSRNRIPILSWCHPTNGASITRGSQPLVGLRNNRSTADEEYLDMLSLAGNGFLYILDSRPKASAIANRARGGGYEDTSSGYNNCLLEFEGIPNIHVIRESFNRIRDLCQPEVEEEFFQILDASNWFTHISVILQSLYKTVFYIDRLQSSVFLHCSDGWDRTAQMSALSQLCLDPYFRSIKGFEVLIEKEFLFPGHKFNTRCGHGDENASDSQRAPIFPQFLDVVYQLTLQFPYAFQFNEDILICILDSLYNCLYGTFLYNTHQERVNASLSERTSSLWSFINSNTSQFLNPFYSSEEAVLYPDSSFRVLRLWNKCYMRWYYCVEADSLVVKCRERRGQGDMVKFWRNRATQLAEKVKELKTEQIKRKLKRDLVSRKEKNK